LESILRADDLHLVVAVPQRAGVLDLQLPLERRRASLGGAAGLDGRPLERDVRVADAALPEEVQPHAQEQPAGRGPAERHPDLAELRDELGPGRPRLRRRHELPDDRGHRQREQRDRVRAEPDEQLGQEQRLERREVVLGRVLVGVELLLQLLELVGRPGGRLRGLGRGGVDVDGRRPRPVQLEQLVGLLLQVRDRLEVRPVPLVRLLPLGLHRVLGRLEHALGQPHGLVALLLDVLLERLVIGLDAVEVELVRVGQGPGLRLELARHLRDAVGVVLAGLVLLGGEPRGQRRLGLGPLLVGRGRRVPQPHLDVGLGLGRLGRELHQLGQRGAVHVAVGLAVGARGGGGGGIGGVSVGGRRGCGGRRLHRLQ
jgi:hypothetical protein